VVRLSVVRPREDAEESLERLVRVSNSILIVISVFTRVTIENLRVLTTMHILSAFLASTTRTRFS